MAMRSALRSPLTRAVLQIWIRSAPVNLPCTRPRTTTSRAVMSALTVAFGPMVITAFPSVILPSIWPSINKSSSPFTSPLIFMPWLTQAVAFEETGRLDETSFEPLETEKDVAGLPEPVEISGETDGFPSSLRHIGIPQLFCAVFKAVGAGPGGHCDSES